MMETPVSFTTQDHTTLSGMYHKGACEHGVIITHPHPLFGGDMDNPVVTAIAAVYRERGYATLRFNFRGVGASSGRYDDGKGETEDVIAAIGYLGHADIGYIALSGYSFGAWVNARAASRIAVADMVMVSPPVSMMDFQSVGAIDALSLVVTGSRDDISPAERIHPMLATWNKTARLEIINGADHFYAAGLPRLKAAIAAHIA